MTCPCCSGKLYEECCEPFHFKKEFPNVDYQTPLKDYKNGLPTEIAEDGIHPTKLDGKNSSEIFEKNPENFSGFIF